MALEMVRIDDRFIHGQVVIGWCPRVKPNRLLLCDDEVAESEWECELFKEAADDYEISIHTIADTANALKSNIYENDRLFLIVSSPRVLVELVKQGVQINDVIVGGMHYNDGKRKVLNFLYVDDDDLRSFKFLFNNHVKLEARDVPDCRSVDLVKRLRLT